jgi:hypothetical protein
VAAGLRRVTLDSEIDFLLLVQGALRFAEKEGSRSARRSRTAWSRQRRNRLHFVGMAGPTQIQSNFA